MDEIRYVKAEAEHAEILADFQLSFSEEFHGKQDPGLVTQLRTNLTEFYSRELNKTYFSWFAVVNGSPAAVGGVCIRVQPANVKNPSGRWGYLFGVYTYPEFRRRSLSKNIVARLMQSAKELGITALELHATKVGEPLYIQSGFTLHNEPTYRQFLNP